MTRTANEPSENPQRAPPGAAATGELTEVPRPANRYHWGQHAECITCGHILTIAALEARIAVLTAAATDARNFLRNLVELGGLEYQGDRDMAQGRLAELDAALANPEARP